MFVHNAKITMGFQGWPDAEAVPIADPSQNLEDDRGMAELGADSPWCGTDATVLSNRTTNASPCASLSQCFRAGRSLAFGNRKLFVHVLLQVN